MREDANVLRVAMDSGFGSFSAFQQIVRKLASVTQSDFLRGPGKRQIDMTTGRRAPIARMHCRISIVG